MKGPDRDEPTLSLETVAEIYQVRAAWLLEAVELGLLGPGVGSGTRVRIATVQLDRVATIVRLNQRMGLGLDAIGLALDRDEL